MGFVFLAQKTKKTKMSLTTESTNHQPLTPHRLNHLKNLEAESIYIMREAAAEFAHPVMLYSIGKDSSVMLRLAQKAFFPGKDSLPAAAHRYQLQISGDDRVSRLLRARNRG